MAGTERNVSFIIGANIKNFQKNLNKAQKRFKRFGRKMQRIGSSMTQNITTPITIAAGASLKMAADFEKSMTKIETLVGLSSTAVDGMKDSVIDLSNQTGQSSKQLADALFAVTSAGLRGEQALQVLEQSAKASAIGLGETKQIARTTTAILNAYGKENISASEATDKLTAIVREGNLEAEELAGSLGRVLGPASQMGVSFSEVGASIATYTRLGVSAKEATTGLRSILNSLIKTTPKQRKAFKELGTSAQEIRQQIGQKGLAKTLTDLIKSSDGNIETLGKLVPNVRALSAVLGTAGSQGQEYNQIVENIADSNEIVNDGFATVSETVTQKFNKSIQKLTNLGIKIGSKLIPVFNNLIEKTSVVFDWFSNLSSSTIEYGIAIAGIVAALGPLLSMFGTLATVIGALMSPVTLVIAGLAGLIVVGKNIIDNWDIVTASLENLWASLSNSAWSLVASITDAFVSMARSILDSFKAVTDRLAPSLSPALEGVDQFLKSMSDSVNKNLKESDKALKKSYKNLLQAKDGAVGFGESLGDIKDTLGGWLTGLKDYIFKTDKASESTRTLSKELQNLKKGLGVSDVSVSGDSASKDETGDAGVNDKQANRHISNLESMTAATTGFKTATEAAMVEGPNLFEKFVMDAQEAGKNFNNFMASQMTSAVSAFAQSVGKSMAGVGNEFATGLEKILLIVADFAKQLGQMLIAMGSAMLLIPGTQGPGALYLAGGAALTAIATGVSAGINKRMQNREQRGQAQGMADGGIVPPGFPNDTFPAMLSSGETVIPKPKPLPSGMGGGQMITNVVNLDGKEIFRNQKEVNHRINR
ncbi:phage tail tape measure protein [Aliifodinibius sp. S!AR15-10]|uniref:phage tail tape measure protein n=1 Tax=Aliifodinibius sp. S!AR15-10 TaxID=2950437 RepID=UPI0028553392|nr:phage tail tape measure protein [Aliifodinibius sp. S!AR15-10]MDR8391001.1 phage tail tape measure protein [Aliifodinibius sp. S!AR15-10]